MRRICRYLPLFLLSLLSIQLATAQSGFDVNLGFGGVHDKSFGFVDQNTLVGCGGSTTNCAQAKALSAFVMGFGANLMLWKKLGIGGEYILQPKRQDYVTLTAGQGFTDKVQTRTGFYDFNVIAQPISQKRAALQLIGGIGGVNTKFYEKQSTSGSVLGNTNNTQYTGYSANHFQLHVGAGVQLYVTDHVFIRPQFDVHFVRNLNEQFGSNLVPGGTIWLGYSFGDRP